MTFREIQRELRQRASKKQARILQSFFKTGPGEYAEGDVFLGVYVPATRKIARQYKDASLAIINRLLRSRIHEERLLALLILVHSFETGELKDKERIYKQYLANTRYINNWDLVDLTAPNIVGTFLLDRSRQQLHRLAKSTSLWERRISIVATYTFIRRDDFEETLRIAEKLITDNEDLIHKATGWMLREVGKRDIKTEEAFLKTCYNQMPRTMLRYAIEKFPEKKRQGYLKGKM